MSCTSDERATVVDILNYVNSIHIPLSKTYGFIVSCYTVQVINEYIIILLPLDADTRNYETPSWMDAAVPWPFRWQIVKPT